MVSYWSYEWLILCLKWKGRGVRTRNFNPFSFFPFFFFVCVFVCVFVRVLLLLLLLFCLLKKMSMLSCFINFIFNSFVVSYWMYFVVIEKKNNKQKSLWSRRECKNLSKASDISSVTARVAPDLLNAVTILSDTTVRRFVVDGEDIHHTGNQKKGHISPGDPICYNLQVFQRL